MSHETPLQGRVSGTLIRGGTSKGLFVRPDRLPDVDEALLDTLVLELFGSPDPLQIDGIGGSHSHTSKLMIVEGSERDGIDLEYTFGQVGVDEAVVDWSGNCGNLTSAVGMFGAREGMVGTTEPDTELTLYNTNTDTIVEQNLPVVDGQPAIYGDYEIDGVPGSGARIDSTFLDPGGGVLDAELPTGNAIDTVTVDGTEYDVSLVDVTNPCVFVRAGDFDLDGTERPDDISATPGLLDRLELVRGAVCERLGLVADRTDARTEHATVPFIAALAPPRSYETTDGATVNAADIDITARIVTTQTPHHAYAVTGAQCLAGASRIRETIPNEYVSGGADERVTIGHPKGTITVGVRFSTGMDGPTVDATTVGRTARPILDAECYYRYVDGLERLR